MKLYNSISNELEEFIPKKEKVLNMYVCGPTVNKRTHLGHMYPVIFFDTVKRYFEYLGYEVNYASNFTDVDDKIIEAAIEENVTEKDIADKYAALYLSDLHKLNCEDVTYRPRVTEYMSDIIKFISLLLEKGYAYQSGDDIFFSIDMIKDYGKLSNQVISSLDYGNRIDVDDNKKNPYDFVLWKKTKEGIKWDAPFGTGRPGWHTECVVMVNKIFGMDLDIHGGGIDLKFPHHENEIAQANAAYNNNLARYWMHNGHLMLNGEKMSKSIGNVLYVDDILKTYNSNIIRLAILKNHYRLPLSLTEKLYLECGTIDDKLNNVLKQANVLIHLNNIKIGLITKDNVVEEYMNNDFNTSNVITYLLELIKNLNNAIRSNDNTNISQNYDKIIIINYILGLKYELKDLSVEDNNLYNNWINLRKEAKYEEADKLRQQLVEKNIL
ncbi:MAG: cysteine--tRNA ligase [Bacilli bacterium]